MDMAGFDNRGHCNTRVYGAVETLTSNGPVANEDISPVLRTTWCSKAGWKLAVIASILSVLQLLTGFNAVFSSPFIDELTLNLNSTPWNEGFKDCFYQTLIGPSGVIGAGLGGVLSLPLIGVFGLVVPMVGTVALFALSWSMIGASWFAPSPIAFRYLFLVGRLLAGITVGLSSSIRPVYLCEISPRHMRAVLLATGVFTYALGATVTYLLGAFLPYWTSAFVFAAVAVALIPCLACLPETSICTSDIVTNMKAAARKWRLRSRKLMLGPFLTRLGISEVLITVQVLLGYLVIAQYLGPILNVAGASQWSVPHGVTQALTIGLAEIAGGLMGLVTAKKIGHVASCTFATITVCLGHTITGIFFSITEAIDKKDSSHSMSANNTEVPFSANASVCFFNSSIDPTIGELYSPIAFVGMGFTFFSYTMFWVPRQFTMVADLFPDEMRGLGLGVYATSMYVAYSISSILFPIMENFMGAAILFYSLAAACACSAISIPTLIPETKCIPKGQLGDKFTPKQNWTRILALSRNSICGRTAQLAPIL